MTNTPSRSGYESGTEQKGGSAPSTSVSRTAPCPVPNPARGANKKPHIRKNTSCAVGPYALYISHRAMKPDQ